MSEVEKGKRNQKDYSRGKIYIIRNSVNDLTYIGSTCQTLAQRMAQHRRGTNKKNQQHYKLYRTMAELGRDAFYIELIEHCPCHTKDELLKKEGEKIREYQSELNQTIGGRTPKEYYRDHQQHLLEYRKKYREDNKEIIAETRKQIYQQNRETVLEGKKQYYQKNKDIIQKRNKQYGQDKKK